MNHNERGKNEEKENKKGRDLKRKEKDVMS